MNKRLFKITFYPYLFGEHKFMSMSNNWFSISDLTGAQALIDWFGIWPSFHDAELVDLTLITQDKSHVTLHTWQTTKEIDKTGCFVTKKHVFVTFEMNGITDLELRGFNHQNVVSAVVLKKINEEIQLSLVNCFGLAGFIKCAQISVTFMPVEPS